MPLKILAEVFSDTFHELNLLIIALIFFSDNFFLLLKFLP